MTLHLVSHALCPYVQRATIALKEKGVAFDGTTVDLARKPDWFLQVSPLGKTPVLLVDDTPIFESAVILEYLEETQPNPLHPDSAIERAQHRSWIEFGSAILNDIAGLYSAADEAGFAGKCTALRAKFDRVEARLGAGPWFGGPTFGLVDATFGPIFRYFDSFDTIDDFGILTGLPKVAMWREQLSTRPSVAGAVSRDYPKRLWQFLLERRSHLSRLMTGETTALPE